MPDEPVPGSLADLEAQVAHGEAVLRQRDAAIKQMAVALEKIAHAAVTIGREQAQNMERWAAGKTAVAQLRDHMAPFPNRTVEEALAVMETDGHTQAAAYIRQLRAAGRGELPQIIEQTNAKFDALLLQGGTAVITRWLAESMSGADTAPADTSPSAEMPPGATDHADG